MRRATLLILFLILSSSFVFGLKVISPYPITSSGVITVNASDNCNGTGSCQSIAYLDHKNNGNFSIFGEDTIFESNNFILSPSTGKFVNYLQRAFGAAAELGLTRANSDKASPSDIKEGDIIGSISWLGYHTSDYYKGAQIQAIVDSPIGGSPEIPTKLCASTTPDGSTSSQLRWCTMPDGIQEFYSNISMEKNSVTNVESFLFSDTGCDTDNAVEGTLCWNPDDLTLNVVTGQGTTLQVNQETVGIGINKEGTSIPDGSVVAMIGAQGDRTTFVRADGSNVSESSLIGVLTQDCADNAECFVTVFGLVRDFDTSTWASGSKLYINATAPGNFTDVIPTLPNNPVWVATVVVSHANVGSVFVYPTTDPSDGLLANNIWATGDLNVEGEFSGGFIDKYKSGNFQGSLYTQKSDSSLSDSNSLFQVISDTRGTPQFLVQDGGSEQASFITRSFMIVNQNNTLLNSSQNNRCQDWGFIHIDCNTSTSGADLGVTDDIETQALVYANEGFRGHTKEHSAYIALADIPQLYGGTNGEFDDTTSIFCDYTSDNFVLEGWVIILDEEHDYNQAFGDINVIINSSCVELKNNPAWNDDFSEVTWVVKDNINLISQDGGFFEFYVGNDEQSKFQVRIQNGTGDSGSYVKDDAGKDSHTAFKVEQDANGFSSIVQEISYYSSEALKDNQSSVVMLLMQAEASNLNGTNAVYIDMRVSGEPISEGEAYGINMPSGLTNLINVGSEDEVDSSYHDETDITINVTDFGNDVEVFTNDNDVLYVGSTLNFTTLSFSLSTPSSANIAPNYYYCDYTNSWVSLGGVIDSTNGFKNSGTIEFASPNDRGVCNQQINGTPFSNTKNFTYVAIQRTRNFVVTKPVIDRLDISGGATNMFLSENILRLHPKKSPPEDCTAGTKGAIYTDDDLNLPCFCTGTNWVQMDDFSSVCS